MKKSLFFVALCALALTSCSQDEVIQVNQDAVSFSVVADNTSRGTVETTDDIDDFMVKAFNVGDNEFNTTVFMNNMEVYRVKDNGAWSDWTYNSTKFWPNAGAINFYSYSPADLNDKSFATVTIEPTIGSNGSTSNLGAQTIKYTVPTTCGEQIDVLYALNTGLTKADKNVGVNFRHALSQVVFNAKNIKEDLKVEIEGVRVVNVKNDGTLTWPAVATTVQTALDANGDEVDNGSDTEGDSWGTWALESTTESFAADMLNPSATLTGVVAKTLSKTTSPLLLMPQTLAPATIVDNKMNFDGAYFAINCKIWSVENGVETLLWPATDTYAEVAIPVSSPDKKVGEPVWKQGRRYVYTFVFGEGAGYIGEGQVNEGEPVLVPVTFTVTVDKFQTAKESVDMNTGNDAVTGTQP